MHDTTEHKTSPLTVQMEEGRRGNLWVGGDGRRILSYEKRSVASWRGGDQTRRWEMCSRRPHVAVFLFILLFPLRLLLEAEYTHERGTLFLPRNSSSKKRGKEQGRPTAVSCEQSIKATQNPAEPA